MTNQAPLGRLRAAFPWPDRRPDVKPIPWSLDGGGKRLVVEQIQKGRLTTILEIGTFLGGSARRWLEASPDVVVIALDPWPKVSAGLANFARAHRQPEWAVQQLLSGPDALYHTFLVNLWDYKGRIIPVRAPAPAALHTLAEFGIQPDLIYLDADKSGRELEVCHQLFPGALLTGDDWFMGTDRFWPREGDYPIRQAVHEFCREHARHLLVDDMTWVISPDPPSWSYELNTRPRYHFKTARRRLRGAFRWLTGRDRAA